MQRSERTFDPHYTVINMQPAPKQGMNNLLIAFILVEAIQAIAVVVFVLIELFARHGV